MEVARLPLSRISYIVVGDMKLKHLATLDFDNSGTLTCNSLKLQTLTGYNEPVPGSKIFGLELWAHDLTLQLLMKTLDLGPTIIHKIFETNASSHVK